MTSRILSTRFLSALCGILLSLSASGAHAFDLWGWAGSTVTAVAKTASTAVNESIKVVAQTASSAANVVTTSATQATAVVSQAVSSVVVTVSTAASQAVNATVKTATNVLAYVPALVSDGINPVAWATTTVTTIANTLQTLTGAVATTAQTAADQSGKTVATAGGAVVTTASTAVNQSVKVALQVASAARTTLLSAVDAVMPDNPLILGSDDGTLPAHSTCGDAVVEAIQSCSGTIAMTGAVLRQSGPASLYWNHYPVLMIDGVDHNSLVNDGVSPDHAAVPVVSSSTVTGLRAAFGSTTRREYNWWDALAGGTQYVEVSGSRGQGITKVALSGLHY